MGLTLSSHRALRVLTLAAKAHNKADLVKLLVFHSFPPACRASWAGRWHSTMDPRKVAELKGFVQLCETNPEILHHPEMGFFRSWLQRSVRLKETEKRFTASDCSLFNAAGFGGDLSNNYVYLCVKWDHFDTVDSPRALTRPPVTK